MKAAPSNPADRIRMIKASMECHNLGLAAVIPFLGPFFGVAAAFESGRARSYEKRMWNPARRQRLIGFGCGIVGILIWLPADVRIIWALVDSMTGNGN